MSVTYAVAISRTGILGIYLDIIGIYTGMLSDNGTSTYGSGVASNKRRNRHMAIGIAVRTRRCVASLSAGHGHRQWRCPRWAHVPLPRPRARRRGSVTSPFSFHLHGFLGMAVSGGQHAPEQTIGMGGGRCDVKNIWAKGSVEPKYQQSSEGQRR